VYQVYRHLYDYDPISLDTQVEGTDDSNPHWRRERVSFRAAYGTERVPAYLFLPRGAPAPYQAVVFFPGADAVVLPSSRDMSLQFLEFIIRSGRAVVYPVYQETYERHTNRPRTQSFLREISIQRGQDVKRTIDYLETRPDIDRSRMAFYGLSLGAQLGPVYLAIEPRLRTGVLLSGGFETWQMPPEADPVNFTRPRSCPCSACWERRQPTSITPCSKVATFHLARKKFTRKSSTGWTVTSVAWASSLAVHPRTEENARMPGLTCSASPTCFWPTAAEMRKPRTHFVPFISVVAHFEGH
jgi:hypothetical protein